ncbi:MAG: hydroxyacid dehydrogenase [Leclercia sp.]
MKTKAAFFTNQPDKIKTVFAQGRHEQLRELCEIYPLIITHDNIDNALPALHDIEVIISSWGMLTLTDRQLDNMPELKAVFYAAGSTDYFSSPLLARHITISSAWQANAIPVAEFCLAQILLACKGYFHNLRQYDHPSTFVALSTQPMAPGIYGEKVALLGAGAISQYLTTLLQPFYLEVMTIPSRKENRTVSLEEAFEQAFVISNHFPNRADNRGVIDETLLRRMRHGAVFINTGRGLQVNEQALINVFSERTDLTALLDVTKPEPPIESSPLYRLPNVLLTSHIAGSINDETVRLADYILEEIRRWKNGDPLCYAVSASFS